MDMRVLIGVAILAAAEVRAEALMLQPATSAYADRTGEALRNPEGVACSSGKVVVADSGNGRLLVYGFKDGALTGGEAIKFAELGVPVRVQIDSRGNVLVLDRLARRIVRVNERGGFGGVVQPTGVPPAGGYFPVSFKLDSADNIHVLDAASARVVVLSPSGAFIRQLAAPSGARLTDITVDGKGALLAVDATAAQIFAAAAGSTTWAPLGRTLKESLSFPSYLTTTPKGLIVVVDGHGQGLVLLAPDGTYLGRRLAIGRTEGFVYYPAQVCVDDQGTTFVADRGNQRLQIFTEVK